MYLNKIGKRTVPSALEGVSPEVIISETLDLVLPYTFPVWDGTTESVGYVKTVILRHYYFREISQETVARWQWKLNTKLCEVMPYLNRVHEALDEMGSVFETMNVTEDLTIDRTGNTEENETNNTSANMLHSDTPQDGLEDVIAGKYLSSADVNTGEGKNQTKRELTSKDIHALQRHGFQGNRIGTIKELASARISWENMLVSSVGELFMGIIESPVNLLKVGGCYE